MYVFFQIRNAVVGHFHPFVHQRHGFLQHVGALDQVVVLVDLLLQLLQPVGHQRGALAVGKIAARQRPHKAQHRYNDRFRHLRHLHEVVAD